MKFRSGDLVRCNAVAREIGRPIELYSTQPSVDEPSKKVVGFLDSTSAALVIWSSLDATNVYVVGPHGMGFTFGALLAKIEKM